MHEPDLTDIYSRSTLGRELRRRHIGSAVLQPSLSTARHFSSRISRGSPHRFRRLLRALFLDSRQIEMNPSIPSSARLGESEWSRTNPSTACAVQSGIV